MWFMKVLKKVIVKDFVELYNEWGEQNLELFYEFRTYFLYE